ncbi:YncE family protein, partial [Klebsiella aerogenes]|uniref:YncE family protein n=1 Tax=Klebsiella aerogenes TaxID=548 RepID=UPI001901985A
TGTLPVGTNPERMALLGGSLYVTNTGTSTLTIINDANGTVTGTVALPSPAGQVVVDKNNSLWVLCGSDYFSQPATLLHFNAAPSATTIQKAFPFASASLGGGDLRLSPDGQQLYYNYNGAEYRMNITDTSLPTTPLIRRDFYGFDID